MSHRRRQKTLVSFGSVGFGQMKGWEAEKDGEEEGPWDKL